MKILNKIKQISKAYTEGIYADTPANRKLGRVGMSYAEYSKKLKDEKEEQADKKYWLIQFDSGEEDIFTEDKMSKEKLVEEACKFAKDIAEANDYDEYKFNIQENTNDWEEEDFDKKEYDWLSIKAKKHNGKYEISVYDWRTHEYIRNDKQKREEKNFQQKIKRDKEKFNKEFKERFGWMEEFFEYKKKDKKEKIKEYISSIRDKEVRQMAEDAVVKMIELGVNIEDLPKIEYKYIEKQKNEGIHPLAGYDTYSNKLLISSRHDFKETADKIYSLGYNIQPNPILHELGHWFIHKNNKNHNLHKHEKVSLLSKDIEEQVSGRATVSRGEFEAELIAGILVGKKFKPEIMMQSDLRFNKDDISKKLYKMGLDGNDRIWEGFHKVGKFSQDKNN